MFDNDESRAAADELARIWDDVTRSGAAGAPEGSDAALASRLQQMVPPLNDTTRERMRARVLASQRGEAQAMSQSVPLDPTGAVTSLPRQPRSISRPRRLDHPIMRIAAMILLALAIGGTWLGIRSFDNSDDPSTPTTGAVLGTPSPDTTAEVGFRETAMLFPVAAIGESRQFTASISRVTLPAGTSWDFSDVTLSVDAFPFGLYVESGTLAVTDRGERSTEGKAFSLMEVGGAFNNGIPSLLENKSSDPVTFIMLVLHTDGDILPTLPSNATSEVLGDVPISQPLGSVTNVNFSRLMFNTPDSKLFTSDGDETLAFVAVNSGTLAVKAPAGDHINLREEGDPGLVFTPTAEDWTPIGFGDSVTADPGSTLEIGAGQNTSTLTSAYLLTVQQDSPEEVAQQQFADGATINWTIPEGSETAGMLLRTISLDPGAEWSYQFDGVVLYQATGDNLSVGLGSSDLTQLTTGQYFSQSGSGELTIRNTGTEPASLLQASMKLGTLTSSDIGGVPPDGVFRHFISSGQVPVVPGDIEIHLNKQTISIGSVLSTDSELGATLMAVYGGSVAFTPIDGDISIVPQAERGANVASTEVSPVAGEPTTLNTGDAAVVREGASYSMTAYGDGESLLLWFWFQPVEDEVTPTPTAAAVILRHVTPEANADLVSPTPTPAPAR